MYGPSSSRQTTDDTRPEPGGCSRCSASREHPSAPSRQTEHHALIIVNNGDATYAELAELVGYLQSEVRKHFGVDLELEPVLV